MKTGEIIEDIKETEWLKTLSNNAVFEFLDNPDEDIYNEKDGVPLKK